MPNNNFMSAPDATAVLTPYAESIRNLKITALKETSPATSVHKVGSYLTYNNVIYSVKAAIAVGDTLIVDTNIEVADIPEGAVVYWEDDSAPSGQVQSDWNQTDSAQPDYIKNKPSDDVVTLNGNPLSFTTDSEQAARECVITFEPIQAGSGDPSPSNVREIRGYDEVILSKGKNQFFLDVEVGNYAGADKDNTTNRRLRSSELIPTNPNTTYSISFVGDSDANVIINYINSARELISQSGWLLSGANFTTPQGTVKIGIIFKENPDRIMTVSDISNIQLEFGSTATTYEAPDIITESLPETVYGGTLNVETGELVVDRGIVDLGDLDWIYNSNYPNVFYSTDEFNYLRASGKTMVACDSYICTDNTSTGIAGITTDYSICTIADESYYRIYTKDTRYSDRVAYKTAMSGVKAVYKLATPYTIHLTPAQVRLLQGNNVVTTNGTSIKLTYRNGELATLADVSSVAESVNAFGKKVKFKKVLYTAQSAESIPAETAKDYDISEVIPSGYIPISVAADQYLSAANAVVVGAPFRKNSDSKWYIQVYNWYSQELSMQPRFYILCTTWE